MKEEDLGAPIDVAEAGEPVWSSMIVGLPAINTD